MGILKQSNNNEKKYYDSLDTLNVHEFMVLYTDFSMQVHFQHRSILILFHFFPYPHVSWDFCLATISSLVTETDFIFQDDRTNISSPKCSLYSITDTAPMRQQVRTPVCYRQ
jgi:K+-transporting ATPase A subunit